MLDTRTGKTSASSLDAAELTLSGKQRALVLCLGFAGLLFDGVEMGLMPVASLSVSKSLLGAAYSDTLGGEWFARFTAALMLGAAIGGIALGTLGDRIGRARAFSVCALFYSFFAGLGGLVQSQEQMLGLRFLVGLGAGGMWPNAVALISECWPGASRPLVAGVAGAGINTGYLLLSLVAFRWHVTPESWRWIFYFAALPVTLGTVAFFWLPESPQWLASRKALNLVQPPHLAGKDLPAAGAKTHPQSSPLRDLFRPPLLRTTLVGLALGSVPLVGAWAASKWMVPWADKIGGATQPGYKALTTLCWAAGATLGSFCGSPFTAWIGRRRAYFLISLGATALTCGLFTLTRPLEAGFLPMVLAQGFVATLFFGWLPLCLPELFPTRVRATGSGLCYNSGRFATAVGVFFAGTLFAALGGSYSKVGAVTGLIYGLGMVAIWFVPTRSKNSLDE
ncbi:MAG: MFS transporter [Verrucomicrobia bacterium]|nr:MFS transporter [Verrucomicrobiota bacterium]